MNDTQVILTTKEVLFNFSISREQLRRWTERGLPKISRGRFDLKTLIQWRDRTLLALDAMAKAKLLREESKAKIEEMKVKKMAGELISYHDIIQGFRIVLVEVKTAFMNQPRRMASTLAPITNELEIEDILRRENRMILKDLSEGGKREIRNRVAKGGII